MERWADASSSDAARCRYCERIHQLTLRDVLTCLPVLSYTYTLCTLRNICSAVRKYGRRVWRVRTLRNKLKRGHPLQAKRQRQRFFIGFLLTVGLYVWLTISDVAPSADHPSMLYTAFTRDSYKHLHKRYLQQNQLNTNFSLSDVIEVRQTEQRHLHPVDCPALFAGDEKEHQRARDFVNNNPPTLFTPEYYLNLTSDCENFRSTRGYITKPLSKEEEEFPIAYGILMYKDVYQVERLLRSIYMPQNFYCLHVDAKAEPNVVEATQALASCLPNVMVVPRPVSVIWGHVSVIYAELSCIMELLKYQWKYYINLTGQMLPLHSNRELVQILQLYDGANDIEGTVLRYQMFWMTVRQTFRWRLLESIGHMIMTVNLKESAPKNATIYKGSAQGALSRAFTEFLFYSEDARNLLVWFEDTYVPDEYFWPTLNHNPQFKAPGAYVGDPETKVFTARASIWQSLAAQINWSWDDWVCQGQWVREICVYGIGDLPWLAERPELFANKFFLDFEHIAYDCLEELIFNRTVYPQRHQFHTDYYKALDIVRNKDLIIPAPQQPPL